MFKHTVIFSLMLAGCLYAPPLLASPFCVQAQGISPQCDYVDAAQCRKRAHELAGVCIANPAELILRPGIGRYCLVDSGKNSLCIYADRTSCDADAVRNNGVCIENVTASTQPNPYQDDPNRKY